MKRARIGLAAIVALSVATVAFAQAKPDFSGTWTPEPAAAPPAGGAPGGGGGQGGGGGRGGGGPMTVKQSATELSVETTGRNGAQTRTYKLDGTPSKITMGQMEATATAKWDGNKLVITTKTDNGESTATWSLANGVLTVDNTGGRGPSTRTYKKST